MAELQDSFLAFCDAVKKGSNVATDKTVRKICQDCKIYCKGMDANRVDIQLRKHMGNANKSMDFAAFCGFLEGPLAASYQEAKNIDYSKAVEELKSKIASGGPKGHGVTNISKDDATKRLTDTKGYTGSHKERFDETGAGKGIKGREYLADKKAQEGYVGGYKGMNTYEKK